MRKIWRPFEKRPRVGFEVQGETMTKQSHKAECDVNTIMKKFEKTGMVTHVKEYRGEYGNFLGAAEFHEAWNEVLKAREMFESLPAKVRKRFENDPGEFLEFVHDPANEEEMIELGLARRREAPPEPAPAAPEPEPSAA